MRRVEEDIVRTPLGLVLAYGHGRRHPRQVDLARKRLKRQSHGLFEAPDRRDEDEETGVFGGPAGDSGLFGGPGHNSGLLEAPDRAHGEMPGLFERPPRTADDDTGSAKKPARPAGGGLFDKPAPRRK